MMQHLERVAKRLCLEHARAYAKSVKPELGWPAGASK